MPLTQAEKQAYARAKNTTIEIWAVELRHSTFPNEVRIVNYQDDVTHTLEASAPVDANTAVLFTGVAFDFETPKVGEDPVNTVQIKIDGVGGIVQPYLATAGQTLEPIEATLRCLLYDVSTDSVLHQSFTLQLRVMQSVSTMTQVAMELGRINSANQTFPNEFYTALSNPGLE